MLSAFRPLGQEQTPTSPDIVAKIQWLMLFRVLMITVLLGSTLLVNVNDADFLSDPGTRTMLGLIIGTYAATIIYALVVTRTRYYRAFAYVQLLGDLGTTLVLVTLTGGSESVFLFMFSLTVMTSAIVLFRQGALILATVAALLVLGVTAQGWFVAVDAGRLTALEARSMVLSMMTNVVALYLVALLAGHLSEQLRATGRRLETASADLDRLRALNEYIITSLQSGLVSYALDGRVLVFNSAAERITGLSPDATVGRAIEGVFPGLVNPLDDQAHGPPKLSRWEQSIALADGTGRTLGMSQSKLLDADGVHQGYIIMFQDLTPLRDMEEQMRRSEKFAAVGKMAAGIAHEIRNPLASISGSIQMLNRTATLDATDRRLIEIALREIDRLNALVTDFLKFARPAPAELVRVHLRGLLEEVVHLFGYMHQREGGESRWSLDLMVADTVWVAGDPRQLKQVFWNLMNNSAEAMTEGGLIQIHVVVVGSRGADDDAVEVRVVDSGSGIRHENLTRIFDPFFSTKSRGTGLGLALVHRIIEEHGGSIRVESEPDLGTSFFVRFPPPASVTLGVNYSPIEGLS